MVAGKMDAVSVNRVWEEHVKKENLTLRLNETYKLTDPRKIDILPEKPNRTIPMPNPDQATIMAATAKLGEFASLKDTDKQPAERFALPLTGNMEYGFFQRVMAGGPNVMFHHPLSTCDVTGYAIEYAKSNGGIGPYTTRLH